MINRGQAGRKARREPAGVVTKKTQQGGGDGVPDSHNVESLRLGVGNVAIIAVNCDWFAAIANWLCGVQCLY